MRRWWRKDGKLPADAQRQAPDFPIRKKIVNNRGKTPAILGRKCEETNHALAGSGIAIAETACIHLFSPLVLQFLTTLVKNFLNQFITNFLRCEKALKRGRRANRRIR